LTNIYIIQTRSYLTISRGFEVVSDGNDCSVGRVNEDIGLNDTIIVDNFAAADQELAGSMVKERCGSRFPVMKDVRNAVLAFERVSLGDIVVF
jgi:hypothetical protein